MFEFEVEILKLLQNVRTDFLNIVFEFITILGEELPMVLIIAILYFAINKQFAQKLFFITVSSLSINNIIKNIVKLPRPFSSNRITCVRPETATGYSFPSGHTQNFATWSTVLSIRFKKIWFIIITTVLIILVAFSRAFLGAHFPSDVIVGTILGVIIAFIGNNLYDKIENKRKLYINTILILTPFVLFFIIKPDILFADFYKMYGMLIGLLLATIIEEKYAPLEYNVAWWKKTTRIIIGIVFAYLIKEGMKIISINSVIQISLLFDAIRYFVLIFVVFGVCPIIFKKIKI